jgi:hypothetical protein
VVFAEIGVVRLMLGVGALSLLLAALRSHRTKSNEERLFLGDTWQVAWPRFAFDHWYAARCVELAEPRIQA